MNNLMQLLSIIKSGGDPKVMLTNMIRQSNNPIMRNVESMMNANNTQGLEQIARNLAREKNVDIDSLLKQIPKIS